MSDNGHTLFRTDYDAGGGTGLHLKSGATLYEVANSSGPLAMVRNACMNNSGQYAFLANRDDGSQGIYVGSGTSYELLISTGTMLDGNVISGRWGRR